MYHEIALLLDNQQIIRQDIKLHFEVWVELSKLQAIKLTSDWIWVAVNQPQMIAYDEALLNTY